MQTIPRRFASVQGVAETMKETITDKEHTKLLEICEELHVSESQVIAALIHEWLERPIEISVDLDFEKSSQ